GGVAMLAVVCPGCGRQVQVPEGAARPTRCPACSGALPPPATPGAGTAWWLGGDAAPAPVPTLARTETSPGPAPAPGGTTAGSFPFLGAPQAPDEIGRLGGYRVLRALGQGGMGVVFEAEDVTLKRRVALKVMKPEAAAHPDGRARFLREARTAAALSHDHIIP